MAYPSPVDPLAAIIALVGGPGLPDPLPAEPFTLLGTWLADAARAKRVPNPDAMTLATATTSGHPSTRMVLCKAIEPDAGALVFYSNRNSRKGHELAANPRASALFHFDHDGRQARIEGTVTHTTAADSDAYFASRHPLSRLGAWASAQSEPVASRKAMAQRVADAMRQLGLSPAALAAALATGGDVHIPRPPHWGGYRLTALRVELWMNAAGRLHDRAEWVRAGADAPWRATRLQP